MKHNEHKSFLWVWSENSVFFKFFYFLLSSICFWFMSQVHFFLLVRQWVAYQHDLFGFLSFTVCSSSWIKAAVFKVTVSSSDHLTSSETAEGASLFQHKGSGFLLSFFVVPLSIFTTSFSPLDFCFSSIIHYPCAWGHSLTALSFTPFKVIWSFDPLKTPLNHLIFSDLYVCVLLLTLGIWVFEFFPLKSFIRSTWSPYSLSCLCWSFYISGLHIHSCHYLLWRMPSGTEL